MFNIFIVIMLFTIFSVSMIALLLDTLFRLRVAENNRGIPLYILLVGYMLASWGVILWGVVYFIEILAGGR